MIAKQGLYCSNNLILAGRVQIPISRGQGTRMDGAVRNNNALIIGGPGTGRTYSMIEPNILQMNASYVIADPGFEIYQDTAGILRQNGYVIKLLNVRDPGRSDHYNPVRYIKTDKDVANVCQCLVRKIMGHNLRPGDLWERAITILLQSFVFYIRDHEPDEKKRNLPQMITLLGLAGVDNAGHTIDEDNVDTESKLDSLFNAVKHGSPNEICVKQYEAFKMLPRQTAVSILIWLKAKLSDIFSPAVMDVLNSDEMELELTGDRKTAIFIGAQSMGTGYECFAAMLYYQLFSALCRHVGDIGGNLKIPVICMMNDFGCYGSIPDLLSSLETIGRHNISVWIFLSDVTELL